MTTLSATARQEQTVDAFLGGSVTLIQPRRGHRAGLDAALLQALVPGNATGLAIDLGSGVGTVAFSIAARAQALSIVGVERDPTLVAFGTQALTLPQNARFARRVRLIAADVAGARSVSEAIGLGDSKADWVLMNPPFDPEGRGSPSPDAARRDAHVAESGSLKTWIARAASILAPGGRLALIYRGDAVAEVLQGLPAGFGAVRVWPVHPSESAAAGRVLVTARRGSRAPLAIMPGLILHKSDGSWTPRADEILRGKSELAA
jgi:tRNA1(Val) A37 N6-methylase TrmN6